MRRATLALLTVLACRPATPTPPAACTGTITDAAFLTGTWQHQRGDHRSDESWSAPAGGGMLGHGRRTTGTTTDFFEFLRIEARPAGLVYIAQPGGGPPVEFPQSRCAAAELEFTNRAHDYPQQLRYRLDRDGDALHIEISGPGRDGGQVGEQLTLQRAPP